MQLRTCPSCPFVEFNKSTALGIPACRSILEVSDWNGSRPWSFELGDVSQKREVTWDLNSRRRAWTWGRETGTEGRSWLEGSRPRSLERFDAVQWEVA